MVMKILILIYFCLEIKEIKISRGHKYTLAKKQCRLDVRKYSFSQRTISVWKTYQLIVYKLVMFKYKIDKYPVSS